MTTRLTWAPKKSCDNGSRGARTPCRQRPRRRLGAKVGRRRGRMNAMRLRSRKQTTTRKLMLARPRSVKFLELAIQPAIRLWDLLVLSIAQSWAHLILPMAKILTIRQKAIELRHPIDIATAHRPSRSKHILALQELGECPRSVLTHWSIDGVGVFSLLSR